MLPWVWCFRFVSRLLLAGLFLWSASACSEPAYRQTYEYRLPPQVDKSLLIETTDFRHRVFFSPEYDRSSKHKSPLIVLIHGDGAPVDGRGRIRQNPTPPESLLLHTARDLPFPWVMIGRPCYFLSDDPACDARWWTIDRYHERVAESLQLVLNNLMVVERPLIWIAYSGGASLAYRLARDTPGSVALITLAGNLDVTRWVNAHGYTPMAPGYINPYEEPVFPCHILQMHLAGAQDENIPAEWVKAFSQRQQTAGCENVRYVEIPGASHTQGWENWAAQIPWQQIPGNVSPP